MNDTHGVNGEGWYGFDLDGTLAVYDKWQGIDHIGEPIKPMVDLIKKMHDEGKVVKIMTARVSPRSNPETKPTRYPMYANSEGKDDGDIPEYAARIIADPQPAYLVEYVRALYKVREWTAEDFIADWCLERLGFLPEIVYQKDHLMLELYDDRVKQVVPNDGALVEDRLSCAVEVNHNIYARCNRLDAENLRLARKLDCKTGGFFSGLMLGFLITMVVAIAVAKIESSNRMPVEQSLQRLHEAVGDAMKAIHQFKTEE